MPAAFPGVKTRVSSMSFGKWGGVLPPVNQFDRDYTYDDT